MIENPAHFFEVSIKIFGHDNLLYSRLEKGDDVNTVLWVFQAILALIFFGSGIAKSVMSKEKMLATGQTGAAALPLGLARFVAVCELAGALGLILPGVLSVDTLLTPMAAIGLGIIMIGAAVVHFRIHEFKPILVNAILLAMCCVVAYGRA